MYCLQVQEDLVLPRVPTNIAGSSWEHGVRLQVRQSSMTAHCRGKAMPALIQFTTYDPPWSVNRIQQSLNILPWNCITTSWSFKSVVYLVRSCTSLLPYSAKIRGSTCGNLADSGMGVLAQPMCWYHPIVDQCRWHKPEIRISVQWVGRDKKESSNEMLGGVQLPVSFHHNE